jgi:glycosyltransferase involved in cell wall biosynthesis
MGGVRQSTSRALHLGVNAHLLSLAETYRSAGINSYIHNLLHQVGAVAPEIRCTVFLGERRYAGEPGLDLRFSRLPTHRPLARILWEQAIQPWALRQARVDLVHGPAFVGPLFGGCPFLVTVHDLSFLFFPQGFRASNRVYLRLLARRSAQQARRIIAVSESTKRDLVAHYGLSPAKVDVIPNGVDPSFQPLPAAQVASFRAQRTLPERLILFVGTLEPRKNVAALVQAYARLPEPRPPLVLIGGRGWLYDDLFRQIEALNLSDQVRHVGYVPAEDLPLWYNVATLFVYPSLYEGFGLPVLEAMACGVPVVTSSTSSLPEVVGPAGLLVDPANVEDLAGAMERALSDPALCAEMRSAGLERARQFSWRRTAAATVDSYWLAHGSQGGQERV